MQTYRKELVATPRKTASGGKFQADLAPADILDEVAIAERWAQSAAISPIQAEAMLVSLEGYILEAQRYRKVTKESDLIRSRNSRDSKRPCRSLFDYSRP